VDRDLLDASGNISPDWRFGIAYNAVLKLATLLLHASGHRPERNLQHFRTLQAVPLLLGGEWERESAYLDSCRMKRNTVEYDCAGGATHRDADEQAPGGKRLAAARHFIAAAAAADVAQPIYHPGDTHPGH
jgi:hypothetical protein